MKIPKKIRYFGGSRDGLIEELEHGRGARQKLFFLASNDDEVWTEEYLARLDKFGNILYIYSDVTCQKNKFGIKFEPGYWTSTKDFI